MGTRFFLNSSSQLVNRDGLKEKLISIDNTTLILPCSDEWDLNSQIQQHDHKIMQQLLADHEGIVLYFISSSSQLCLLGKIWFDLNTWIFYRIRVKSWIQIAARDNVPPQKIFNYALSNTVTNKVILLSDEDFCGNLINEKVKPTLIIPSAVLFVKSNEKDFFTKFHSIIDLKTALRRETPGIDEWIAKNRYGCCPSLDEYIFACRISLKALNDWIHCATQILDKDSYFTMASPKYHCQAEFKSEADCQFDTESSFLPVILANQKSLVEQNQIVDSSRLLSYWNPAIFSPIYTSSVFTDQKILGHLANIQGMAYCDLQSEISKRLKLGRIIDNLIHDHKMHGEIHTEPRMIFEGHPISMQSFPLDKPEFERKISNAYDLTVDICNTNDAEIMDLEELVTKIKSNKERMLSLSWDKILIKHFKISRNAFNKILRHLDLSANSPNPRGKPSFNNWFEKLISHNSWGTAEIDISNSTSSWYRRAVGEHDNVKTSLLLINRFILAITGSTKMSLIPMPADFVVPSCCEPRALFNPTRKRPRDCTGDANPFNSGKPLSIQQEKKRKIFGANISSSVEATNPQGTEATQADNPIFKSSPLSQSSGKTMHLDWIDVSTSSEPAASQESLCSQESQAKNTSQDRQLG
ncbi:unnamed protein product [Oikopleura dioica]|uniref:Uncharacterized protein n=1 Tax=Oikopleura dioica TaxID=34765 RepID=E4YVY3_OIKDI|nr:unnamed protein product [Oikopleura dioica]